MPKYANANRTSADLLDVCDEALRQYKDGHKQPVVNGVTFEHAAALGWCQQHVREAVEATAWGREGVWDGCSCCGTQSALKLRRLGYQEVALADALPGDLIYFSPCGARCGTCHGDAGHTGILHHKAAGGVWYIWQNTSYQHLGLCCITIREWQEERVVGVFRVFPAVTLEQQQATGEQRVSWWGQYLDPADVILQDGQHFVRLRAAAEAEGSVVHPRTDLGKIFVGPKSWWPEGQDV